MIALPQSPIMPPAAWRAPAAKALAILAIVLVSLGALAALALHALEPTLDPLHRMLSDYGDTPHRPVLTLGELAIGAAGVLAACALVLREPRSRATRTGASLLVLAGATILGLAVWPDGIVHIGLVRVGQGVMLGAVGAFAIGAHERRGWRAFEVLSWTLATLTAMGIARMEWLTPWPALTQRVYWAVLIAWVVSGAVVAMRAGPRPAAS